MPPVKLIPHLPPPPPDINNKQRNSLQPLDHFVDSSWRSDQSIRWARPGCTLLCRTRVELLPEKERRGSMGPDTGDVVVLCFVFFHLKWCETLEGGRVGVREKPGAEKGSWSRFLMLGTGKSQRVLLTILHMWLFSWAMWQLGVVGGVEVGTLRLAEVWGLGKEIACHLKAVFLSIPRGANSRKRQACQCVSNKISLQTLRVDRQALS